MSQLPLFRIPKTGQGHEAIHVPAGRNNPHGQEAARDMEKSGKASKQVWRVLSRLSMNGPMSREQLSDRTDIKETSLCGRLDECVKHGWVRVNGETRGRAGKMVNVYAITPAGRERLT